MKKHILLFTLFFSTLNCVAETSDEAEAAAKEAEAAEQPGVGEDVRIYSDKNADIKEYRANGRVYMIMVTPKKGKPYYLVDADGDGEFDTRRNELSPNLKIPSWVIFSW